MKELQSHSPQPQPTKSGAGPSDAALVLAARAGEEWAREALFRRYVRLALGLAYRILPRDADIDDLVQDSFLSAFQRLDRLSNPQAFQAWLSAIVVRTAGKRLRRRRLQVRLGLVRSEPLDVDQVVSRSAPPDVAAELRAVYGLLERLSVEERIALVLRRVERLEIPEIAEQMGLSTSTVKRRLSAAEARLERAIKP
ncbi:MAG TPA: sigma-70 family RNA polymerase sigma factor [Polyangiaceae bacterium]|nr:sigma-70 family RNA polymerase sigma factor [Polyangiaceae bacterium]